MLSEERRYQALFFVFFAANNGVVVFRNVFFEEIGLTGGQMGLIGATLVVTGMVAQPIWGLLADRFRATKGALLAAAGVSGVAVLAYPFAERLAVPFAFLVLASLVFSAFRAPIVPISNAMVLSDGHDYGRVRAFGSIAFGIGSLAIGWALATTGTALIFYVYAVGMLVLIAALFGVSEAEADVSPDLRRDAVTLLADRRFALLLGVAVLLGAVISGGSAYFSIYVRAIDAGDGITGTALFVKTVAEAAVFVSVASLGLRNRSMLTLGIATYVVCYLVYALVPVTAAVLAIQVLLGVGLALHAVALVEMAHEFAPAELTATAQAVLASLGLGTGRAIGELAGGRVMDLVGVQDLYLVVAAVAAVAALVSLGFHLPRLRRVRTAVHAWAGRGA